MYISIISELRLVPQITGLLVLLALIRASGLISLDGDKGLLHPLHNESLSQSETFYG